MNGLGFWLADKLAFALEPHERSVVLGDHLELGASGLQAAWDVGGLVVRRQLEPWTGWRPWFVLVTLVLPFTFLVPVSLDFGRAIALFALLGESSPLPWLFPIVPGLVLTLALCSWNCSFTLAFLSGRRAFLNLAIFWLLALSWVGLWTRGQLRGDLGPTEIAVGFLAFVVVFAIPALTGLRAGRAGKFPSGLVCASLVIAPAAITALLWAFRPLLGPASGWSRTAVLLVMSWPGIWICGRRYLRSITPGAPCPR